MGGAKLWIKKDIFSDTDDFKTADSTDIGKLIKFNKAGNGLRIIRRGRSHKVFILPVTKLTRKLCVFRYKTIKFGISEDESDGSLYIDQDKEEVVALNDNSITALSEYISNLPYAAEAIDEDHCWVFVFNPGSVVWELRGVEEEHQCILNGDYYPTC